MRPATGAIDEIELLPLSDPPPGTTARAGDVLVIRGWAHRRGNAATFALTIDGGAEHVIELSIPRPDVAGALGDPTAVGSGFSASIGTIDLAPGEHALALVVSGEGDELARARFRLNPSVPLSEVEPASGCIEGWTDESGRTERIGGETAQVPRDAVVRVDGWAADTVTQTPAVAAFALVGERVVEAAYGFERQDVAKELGEHHLYCGFSVSFPGTYVERGGTPLRIVILSSDGVTVRPAGPAVTLTARR
jgi:hypothetical protein